MNFFLLQIGREDLIDKKIELPEMLIEGIKGVIRAYII